MTEYLRMDASEGRKEGHIDLQSTVSHGREALWEGQRRRQAAGVTTPAVRKLRKKH